MDQPVQAKPKKGTYKRSKPVDTNPLLSRMRVWLYR